MRRILILGRGAAGKSVLARRLGALTGLPVIELDAIFWQPDLTPAEPVAWVARQREICRGDTWIIDGDLGRYDHDLPIRLGTADTIIILNLALPRVAWRTLRRGRERSDYWRWVRAYRRRYLPLIMDSIAAHAPDANLIVLRNPGMVRRFLQTVRQDRR
jgi:adenylate kinase family enzyme